MAKLTRKTAKVFGETATPTGSNPEIGQFGSAKAGTYVGTGDISTIQALNAWTNGWIDAVTPTQQFPTLPEMTGVHKVLSYQEAYILQEGIPEYDAGTTYYIDSLCKGYDADGHLVIFRSIANDNIGNSITDTTKWELLYGFSANQQLSNLSPEGNDRFHACKSYEDKGELLTDSEGLADVTYYAHSNYDSSKFNVIGNPIITDDGIASNLSASNYVYCNGLPASYNTFEIYLGKFTFTEWAQEWLVRNNNTSTLSTGFHIRTAVATNTARFLFFIGENAAGDIASNQASTTINHYNNLNKPIELKLTFNGSTYTLYSNVDNAGWQEETHVDSTAHMAGNLPFYIGYGSASTHYSVDLKYFAIKVNDIQIFNGNKTGLDVIKPDDYTLSATPPTISADGIVSDFSTTKYIDIPSIDVTGKTFEIDLGKVKPSDVNTTQVYIAGQSTNDFTIGILGTTHMFFISSANLSSGGYSTALTANNSYWVKAGFNGTKGYLKVSTDGINYTTYDAGTASTPFTTLSLRIGANNAVYLKDSFDLNNLKIYVDDKLVYQPCLKIPYVISITGSKVADRSSLSRIIDIYEQYGYAPYYTVTNTDFTLPQGELYGMITRRTENAPAIKNYGVLSFGGLTNTNDVLSGFSATKYAKLPMVFSPQNYSWEMIYKFTTGAGVTTRQAIVGYLENNHAPFQIWINSGHFEIASSSSGSSLIFNATAGTYTVLANTTYWVKATFNGSTYKLSYSTDGTTFTDDISVSSSTTVWQSQFLSIGNESCLTTADTPFAGTIDLSGCSISINSKLVWQGTAPNNEYVTQLNPAVVVDSYIKGSSWYRVWSDGWCEQGGFSTGQELSDIELLQPYVNSNYNILLTPIGYADGSSTACVYSQTPSTFQYIYGTSAIAGIETIYWRASGYIK